MDIDTIQPGEDFVTVIENAVGYCSILIAIIGRQWLSGGGEAGRWLDNPNDYVRAEIATALKRDIRVIPVLMQRASMPKSEDLPDELVRLARRHAVELSDIRWQHDVDKLISVLEGILTPQDETLRRESQEHAGPRLSTETSDPNFWEQQRQEAEARRRLEAAQKESRQTNEQSKREAEQEEERRRRLAEDDLRKRRRKRRLIVAFVLALLFAFVGVVGVIALVWTQTAWRNEQRSADQNATPTNTQQTGQMRSISPSPAARQSLPGDQQAEAEASRAAQTKIEQEAPQKEEVWHVAMIVNKTTGTIPYQILEKGSLTTYTLPPGYQIVHTALNANIDLKYDYKYEAGYQGQEQTLEGTTVVGHSPTEPEKQKATIYYFIVENGDIVMHRQP